LDCIPFNSLGSLTNVSSFLNPNVEEQMSFDDKLAIRVRKILEKTDGLSEKKMFGGLCFLVNGNMAFGLVNDDLMIRVGPDSYEKILSQPHVRKMDFTGKPLKGFLYVGAKGTESDKDLKKWVLFGIEFAKSLPAKNKES
jgi:TfoX/Sxy family transcriptional regulator of competence genes